MTRPREVWAGHCESCLTNFDVIPYPDRSEFFPDLEEWAEPINCPVCWGDLHWEHVTEVQE